MDTEFDEEEFIGPIPQVEGNIAGIVGTVRSAQAHQTGLHLIVEQDGKLFQFEMPLEPSGVSTYLARTIPGLYVMFSKVREQTMGPPEVDHYTLTITHPNGETDLIEYSG